MKKIIFVLTLILSFSQGLRADENAINHQEIKEVIPEIAGVKPLQAIEDMKPVISPKAETKSSKKKPDIFKERKRFNQLSRPTPRISQVSMRDNVVYRLQTALGFVSTIDLPEPALKVFVGDQELFKVGVYEREVLIKPITDDSEARTNLTIVTAKNRLSFDISVGKPETADFVLDFREPMDDVFVENAFTKAVEGKTKEIEKTFQEKERIAQNEAKKEAQESLQKEIARNSQAIELGENEKSGDIRLELLSLSQIGTKGYLRFLVRNNSQSNYQISKAVIGFLPYQRKMLGLRKESEGLIEFPSELKIEETVAPNAAVYGVLIFEPRAKAKKEEPVFMLFEDGGTRHFKIKNFKWVS